MRQLAQLIPVLFIACSTTPPTTTAPDAPAPETWRPLITNSWSLGPSSENTRDLTIIPVNKSVVIGGIRPIAPVGTHHTLLYRGASVTSADIMYASGIGSSELRFPAGTGLRLESGTLVGLQLHVVNVSDHPLSGESGIEVLELDPASVVENVDLMLAGPNQLTLPPGVTTTIHSTCTSSGHQTLFALFPHMHALGTHLKTTITHAGTDRVIHDAPYTFEEQKFYPLESVVLEAGDTITTDCTFHNSTAQVVQYGESSSTEMCYSIVYRFPILAGDFCGG